MGALDQKQTPKMKLFYYATIIGAVYGQSTYEDCSTAAECDYECGGRENCMGTGRQGLIPNKADKACCTITDYDSICDGSDAVDANCAALPANITLITGAAFDCCTLSIDTTEAPVVTPGVDTTMGGSSTDVPVTGNGT